MDDDGDDAAENDGEHGHAERHTTLLRVIDRLLSGVWGGRVRREPQDHAAYSRHRPDLVLLGLGQASVNILCDLKLFSPFSSDPAAVQAPGARVGFGNTRPRARKITHGVPQRSSPGERDYVAPVDGDYAEPLAAGLEVVTMLFETLGGFSPDFVSVLQRAAAEVSNKLSSNQYDETTWSARSWMAFASQQLSVAVQLAVADEISDSYDARCLACAGGDPRRWRVTAGGVRV